MSGLEVAAGIITVAGAGIAVAKGLFDIADAIGSAGWEIRFCAADTDLFSQMLLNLSSLLERSASPSLPHPTQRITDDLLELCERILVPFQRLISKLEPLLKSFRHSQHHLKQIGLRVQWYFRHRSKISLHQHVLGQLKATLSLFLNSMNLQESRSRNAPNAALFRTQVEYTRRDFRHQAMHPQPLVLEDGTNPELQGLQLPVASSSRDTQSQDQRQDAQILAIGDITSPGTPTQNQANNLVHNDPELELDEVEGNALYIDTHALRNRVSRFAEDSVAGTTQMEASTRFSTSSNSGLEDPESGSMTTRESLRRKPLPSNNTSPRQADTFTLELPFIYSSPEHGLYSQKQRFILSVSSCGTWEDLEKKINYLTEPETYEYTIRIRDKEAESKAKTGIMRKLFGEPEELIVTPDAWEAVISAGRYVIVKRR
ncbi:MAG: hypothetical protein Q9222_003446 [Ikaeria aurantiellina]